MGPAGTEEKAERLVKGTNMAWGNAVLSENQNDVEACLTGREYEANIPARATAEHTFSALFLTTGNCVNDGFEDIVGASRALREVLDLVRTVAPTDPLPSSKAKPGQGKNSSRALFMNTAHAEIAVI